MKSPNRTNIAYCVARRAPYGARGLKSITSGESWGTTRSRPVWGAWIEISRCTTVSELTASRPVWGAWIEIRPAGPASLRTAGRAPYGARGLKFEFGPILLVDIPSRPVWGAWIEIRLFLVSLLLSWGRAPYGARGLKYVKHLSAARKQATSRPVWGAWIEICVDYLNKISTNTSRPVWGAWIEIPDVLPFPS